MDGGGQCDLCCLRTRGCAEDAPRMCFGEYVEKIREDVDRHLSAMYSYYNTFIFTVRTG